MAPGFRDFGRAGQLGSVGASGFSWSASPNNTYGVYLYFNATSLNRSHGGHRVHGLQLRCLSE
ncbi:hypothetical protein [uncultured Rikenella sp.]|uniref:hypothetical protein n=1 Tax=uncultured Rikenella sp. TaxID=368003 RepID=UPI0026309EF3|nr:hypothetical protein [uncultured Rikenella sp.]